VLRWQLATRPPTAPGKPRALWFHVQENRINNSMSHRHLRPSTFHLRRRTPGSFLLVPFPQMGRSIRCQGQLEAAAVQILALCPFSIEAGHDD
jgi:hypothetical protein